LTLLLPAHWRGNNMPT